MTDTSSPLDLSEQQWQALQRDGFVVVHSVLPPSEVHDLNARLDDLMSGVVQVRRGCAQVIGSWPLPVGVTMTCSTETSSLCSSIPRHCPPPPLPQTLEQQRQLPLAFSKAMNNRHICARE
jgi:hypothetical protein